MTTVPGTNFTKEQLEAAIRCNGYIYFLHSHSKQANELTFTVDNVSVGGYSGSDRMKQIGFEYHTEKKQYDKALAWYLLAAKENNSHAQNCIGVLYYDGEAVPKNYLCALKWHLKAAEQNYDGSTPNNIGKFFEYGQCVPLDKYKALEWYCRGGDKTSRDRLKSEGYHRSDIDKSKFNSTIDSLY
jgi:TPR repeat protein